MVRQGLPLQYFQVLFAPKALLKPNQYQGLCFPNLNHSLTIFEKFSTSYFFFKLPYFLLLKQFPFECKLFQYCGWKTSITCHILKTKKMKTKQS